MIKTYKSKSKLSARGTSHNFRVDVYSSRLVTNLQFVFFKNLIICFFISTQWERMLEESDAGKMMTQQGIKVFILVCVKSTKAL